MTNSQSGITTYVYNMWTLCGALAGSAELAVCSAHGGAKIVISNDVLHADIPRLRSSTIGSAAPRQTIVLCDRRSKSMHDERNVSEREYSSHAAAVGQPTVRELTPEEAREVGGGRYSDRCPSCSRLDL